jgi:cation:H+ antiporter
LVTSIRAALAGSPGVAVGNVVGSNIANVLLILGVAALIQPLNSNISVLKRDGSMMLAAAVICVGLGLFGGVTRPIGAVMIAALVAYIVFAHAAEKRHRAAHDATGEPAPRSGARNFGVLLFRDALVSLAGLAFVVVGADWLVRGALLLARDIGVSETVIGLSIVAVGTSLPELATSVTAAIRRNPDIAIGNIIGSNIYNVLGILGATALVEPMLVPERIANADNWAMLAATALFLIFAATGAKISRREGALFLVGYGLYLVWLGAAAAVPGAA